MGENGRAAGEERVDEEEGFTYWDAGLEYEYSDGVSSSTWV